MYFRVREATPLAFPARGCLREASPFNSWAGGNGNECAGCCAFLLCNDTAALALWGGYSTVSRAKKTSLTCIGYFDLKNTIFMIKNLVFWDGVTNILAALYILLRKQWRRMARNSDFVLKIKSNVKWILTIL